MDCTSFCRKSTSCVLWTGKVEFFLAKARILLRVDYKHLELLPDSSPGDPSPPELHCSPFGVLSKVLSGLSLLSFHDGIKPRGREFNSYRTPSDKEFSSEYSKILYGSSLEHKLLAQKI